MLNLDIRLFYALSGQRGSVEKQFAVRCENIELSRWSYFIEGCNEAEWKILFLNNVPPDKVKNWIITKTSTHLKVICNRVNVLNFNFATDCKPNYRGYQKVWSFKAKSFKFFRYNHSVVPLVRNLSC